MQVNYYRAYYHKSEKKPHSEFDTIWPHCTNITALFCTINLQFVNISQLIFLRGYCIIIVNTHTFIHIQFIQKFICIKNFLNEVLNYTSANIII